MIKQTRIKDFGKRSGFKVFPVSIGAMRLPDDEKAIPLMRQAIDAGMVYIDTSRGYGDSDINVGKSLKDGYREKVILSTKWCPWNLKVDEDDDASADCTYKRIIESMQRLDVEYLDFYQIWSINNPEDYANATIKGGMLDGIKRAMNEGLVKHTGFTTHDKPENVSRYIDEADWCEAILCSYNILNQAYKPVLAKAHEKGIATIVMNPVAGGMIAEDSPILKNAAAKATDTDDIIEAAHRYLKGDPNIDTIICGITKPSDITSTIENYEKPPLTSQQIKSIEQEMSQLSSENQNFCTGCKYCMPCPEGIKIPEMMSVVYNSKILQLPKRADEIYKRITNPDKTETSKPPADCVQCGVCEERCTQRLKIIEELKYLSQNFPADDS